MTNEEIIREMKSCTMCPHDCRVDRTSGDFGKCSVSDDIQISSYGPHFGEEPELVGFSGSGTIFLSGCNLKCVFCQNFDISHENQGRKIDSDSLIEILLSLQEIGCININLVTPTHFSYQLIEVVEQAKSRGLVIPIVYNSSGYEKVETLKKWEGLVDIYMPDLKFVSPEKSMLFSETDDYFEHASAAIVEMTRQVGDLVIKNGVAKRGLLLRHLVLPHNQSDTKTIIDFVAESLSTSTYFNIMNQYYPAYRAIEHTVINQKVDEDEFKNFIQYAINRGFTRPVSEYFNY